MHDVIPLAPVRHVCSLVTSCDLVASRRVASRRRLQRSLDRSITAAGRYISGEHLADRPTERPSERASETDAAPIDDESARRAAVSCHSLSRNCCTRSSLTDRRSLLPLARHTAKVQSIMSTSFFLTCFFSRRRTFTKFCRRMPVEAECETRALFSACLRRNEGQKATHFWHFFDLQIQSCKF